MMPEDRAVWTKFLDTDGHRIKRVWYDVKVGHGVFLPVGSTDVDKRIAAGLTRKRIDCVCSVGGGFWVVEVKPRASMQAIGQVISYARLFTRDYKPAGEVWPVIVCDKYDQDLLEEFDEFGILVMQND